MGNNSSGLKPPFTEKYTFDYESGKVKIGLCEMQGWRSSMEDASLIHLSKFHKDMDQPENNHEDDEPDSSGKIDDCLNMQYSFSDQESNSDNSMDSIEEVNESDFKETENKVKYRRKYKDYISLFGVFDGHGGSLISRFVADNFLPVFKHCFLLNQSKHEKHPNSKHLIENKTKSFRSNYDSTKESSTIHNKNKMRLSKSTTILEVIEQVLIQTFLDLDDLLLTSHVQTLFRDFRELKRPDIKIDNIKNLLADNTDYVMSSSQSYGYLMGTTANVICIFNNNLIVANVGDSLGVLFQKGKAVILNTEHKVSIQGEEERVLKSGFQIHNGRVDGKLNLTRAIGDLQFKDKKLRPYEQAVTAYPEILVYELDETCEFFVSGCDGIWDCVEPQKFCEYISGELKKEVKISTIIANIQDMILSKTINSPIGTDNMTCMIVKLKSFDNEEN